MISPKDSLLLVIDVQGRLASLVAEPERIQKNIGKLTRTCRLLGVPVIATEQYPAGLGPTVQPVKELLGDAPVIEKITFSCCGSEAFMRRLRSLGRNEIVVVGMEAHVCVYQTCMELLEFGYSVHLVSDAVSSRNEGDRSVAIRSLERAGALPMTTEMAIFELLRTAESEHFKAISTIVKE